MPEPVSTPSTPVTITAADILNQSGAGAENSVTAVPLSATQKAGMQLATGVGIFAFVVTVAIGAAWWHLSPGAPTLPPQPADAQTYLQNYSQLVKIAHDSVAGAFDPVVVKVLLPVFTSILGYIFGTQQNAQGSGTGQSKPS
jgi:hypothetical protein